MNLVLILLGSVLWLAPPLYVYMRFMKAWTEEMAGEDEDELGRDPGRLQEVVINVLMVIWILAPVAALIWFGR